MDTIFFVPAGALGLLILWLFRKLLGRFFGFAFSSIWLGLAGVALGAASLPAGQFFKTTIEHHGANLGIVSDERTSLERLAQLGTRLKQVAVVVIEDTGDIPEDHRAWFIYRLATFTGRPVFVFHGRTAGQATTLRLYRIFAAPGCAKDREGFVGDGGHQMAADKGQCLRSFDTPNPGDWPQNGSVLTIQETPAQVTRVSVIPLREPPSDADPRGGGLFDLAAKAQETWRGACSVTGSSPFPFAYGLRGTRCNEVWTLSMVADRLFGPGPSFK